MNNASLELGGDNWAAKDGNLLGYAVGDSSGRYVPREFDFTRGSNLAATRVAANGLIEKGRENVLLQSNQFDTTWTLSSTSVTSGQAGYDGSSDAWLLNSTTTGFPRIAQNVTSSGVVTYSVYAKAATDGFILMRTFGADSQVWFDLTNGTIANASGAQYVLSKIESVGNGWYRCSVTFNGSLTTSRIYPASAYGTYSTSGNGVYIQDAQVEEGLVATEYIESGATKGKAGILEHSPRFDYSGGATCPSLLLEPSRTNLIGYSEYFEASDWNTDPNGVAISADVTTNYATSPQGLKNATRLRLDLNGGTTNSDRSRIKADFGIGTSGSQVHSIYIKSNDGVTQNVTFRSLGTLTNHEITSDWKRIDLVSTDNSLYFELGIYGNTSYNNTADLLIWGAQIEEGSYPTSYIPTYGSSETRSADGCDKDGFVSSGITTSSNFTFYMELEGLGQNNNPQVYLEDVSGNRILSLNLVGQKNRYGFYSPDASNYVSPSSNEADGIVKIAVTYDGTDFKEYFNGVEKGTRAASVTVGIDGINFNEIPSNSIAVHKAILFPTALSDADCITLTTL